MSGGGPVRGRDSRHIQRPASQPQGNHAHANTLQAQGECCPCQRAAPRNCSTVASTFQTLYSQKTNVWQRGSVRTVARSALTWGALALGPCSVFGHGGVGSLGLRSPVAGCGGCSPAPHRTNHTLISSSASCAPYFHRSQLALPALEFPPILPAKNADPDTTRTRPRNGHTTAEEIIALTKEAIVRDRALEDRIVALRQINCNFETVSYDRRLVLLIFFDALKRRILCGIGFREYHCRFRNTTTRRIASCCCTAVGLPVQCLQLPLADGSKVLN